jgi:hypothetical protein
MYNPNTNDNREYELHHKHTGEAGKTYHTRAAAQRAVGTEEENGDWGWRIRTHVLR